jgi:hypothetical protein
MSISKSIKHSGMNYKDRNSSNNFAEDFFEDYCKNYYIRRVGFDEKNDSIPQFYHLNIMLRNLPDYFVYANGRSFLCNVKGTDNFKKKEFDIIDKLRLNYHSKECPLLYVFCFKENKLPIFATIDEIVLLYNKSEDKLWHDNVTYRNLGLRK